MTIILFLSVSTPRATRPCPHITRILQTSENRFIKRPRTILFPHYRNILLLFWHPAYEDKIEEVKVQVSCRGQTQLLVCGQFSCPHTKSWNHSREIPNTLLSLSL